MAYTKEALITKIVPRNGGLDNLLLWVHLDNDSVLAQLLLHEDDLFGAVDDEVTTGVQRTFIQDTHLRGRLVGQHALGAAQHDRHPADGDALLEDSLSATYVFEIDLDGSGVGGITQSALLRGDGGLNGQDGILGLIGATWGADVDVGELDVEVVVDIAVDDGARLHDLPELDLDKIIEGIDVLLDQALDLEEGGDEIPLVLGGIDGIGEGLIAVEGFEDGVEGVPVAVRVKGRVIWFRVILRVVLSGGFSRGR